MSPSKYRHVLAQLLEGQSPSVVLSMMLEVDPDLDKSALANIF